MGPDTLGARVRRDAFDRVLNPSLRLVLASAGAIYAAFAVVDLVVQAPTVAVAMAVIDGVCALVLLLGAVAAGRWGIPVRASHPVAFAIATLVIAEGGISLLLTSDPLQTVGFMLVVVGAGLFMLSYAWTGAVVVGSVGVWTSAALASGLTATWIQFGMTLLSSCLLAAVAQVVRVRTYERLEVARVREERHQKELETSRAVFRSIVEHSPIYIMRLDDQGTILYLNHAPHGLRVEDIVGRRVTDFVPPEHRERVVSALRHAVTSRAPSRFESAGPGGDGTASLTYDCQMVPLPDEDGRKRVMFLALDVTEQRVAFERLAEINRLKEVGELKTRLLNTASHELNTPITPLKLQIHLLKSARLGALNERQQKAVDMLDRNVERLSGLVTDVLDVARLQSGRLRLDRKPTDIDRVVREAVESFEEPARQSGVDITTSLAAGGEVNADPDRVTQVLFNLVGNALKFTPAGGRIEVETRREPDRVVVRVRDTGVGLTGEQISRLFQPFGQVHDPDERTRAGTGLGLYISKGILEQHGGRIWCESAGPGKGATFAFAIPVASRGVRADTGGTIRAG